MTNIRKIVVAVAAALGLIALAAAADARPTYFEALTSHYGFSSGDNLYACGVCHYRWTGTGARNPYGQAVEQQLYLGKSILQSLQDIEGVDTDSDGFTNGEELITYETLPGYSCSNFFDAIDPDPDYDTFITPFVPSCLEPLDIRVSPASLGMLGEAGEITTAAVTVYNNGSDFPLTISSFGLLAGAHATLAVQGPTAPFDIPVGGSAILDVVFSPVSPIIANGTLRVSSNDPDEPDIDVAITAFGFLTPLVPPEDRAPCLGEIQRQLRKYTRIHLREWGRCYVDEVRGRACNAGKRDLKLQKAEAKLRAAIGGADDRRCASQSLSPSLIGIGSPCGGGCGNISIGNFGELADCLVCRQEETMRSALTASLGTAPPDLPPSTAGSSAAGACAQRLATGLFKGIDAVQKLRGTCELANVTAASPIDCPADLAGDVAAIRARVDLQLSRCSDTSGLLGCTFPPGPDPTCLGTAAELLGNGLVEAAFGLDD